MSGSNLVTNIGKGRFVYYSTLPAANDALIIVPLESSGLVADATLIDYDDLAALLAGATNEQTTAGRKTVTSVTVTVDDTNDRTDVDFADPVWTGLTGNAIAKLAVCYDPDTTGGSDSDLIPLTVHSFDVTPDGSDVTGVVATAGFARAS